MTGVTERRWWHFNLKWGEVLTRTAGLSLQVMMKLNQPLTTDVGSAVSHTRACSLGLSDKPSSLIRPTCLQSVPNHWWESCMQGKIIQSFSTRSHTARRCHSVNIDGLWWMSKYGQVWWMGVYQGSLDRYGRVYHQLRLKISCRWPHDPKPLKLEVTPQTFNVLRHQSDSPWLDDFFGYKFRVTD